MSPLYFNSLRIFIKHSEKTTFMSSNFITWNKCNYRCLSKAQSTKYVDYLLAWHATLMSPCKETKAELKMPVTMVICMIVTMSAIVLVSDDRYLLSELQSFLYLQQEIRSVLTEVEFLKSVCKLCTLSQKFSYRDTTLFSLYSTTN